MSVHVFDYGHSYEYDRYTVTRYSGNGTDGFVVELEGSIEALPWAQVADTGSYTVDVEIDTERWEQTIDDATMDVVEMSESAGVFEYTVQFARNARVLWAHQIDQNR